MPNRKYIDDLLGSGKILGFDQTLENHVKVSVGNDVYNLNNYDEKQIKGSTFIKFLDQGGFVLQQWVIKCDDKNNKEKIRNFLNHPNRAHQPSIQEQ